MGLLTTSKLIKCTCDCHNQLPGNSMMHFLPCCDNGMIKVTVFEPEFKKWLDENCRQCMDTYCFKNEVYKIEQLEEIYINGMM